MMLIAAADNDAFWLIALGMGAVVALVVVALLLQLLHLVKDIDEGVEELTATAGAVAANTLAIEQLPTTAAVLRDIREEALIQYDFLSQQ